MKKLLLTAAVTAALFAGQASAAAVVIPATSPLAVPTKTVGSQTNPQVDFSTRGVQDVRNVPLQNIVYVGGSSAAAKFLESTILSLAKPTTSVYKYTSTAAADILTYVFSAKTGVTGLTASGTYVIHYRNRDGSLMAPLLAAFKTPDKAPVTFNSVPAFETNAATYSCTAPYTGVATGVVTCTPASDATETLVTAPAKATGGSNVSSTLGLSDVDANLFASPLNGANTANGLAKSAPTMGSTAIAAQVFGIAATESLRNAMQVAEVASGAQSNALCSTDAVVRETEACMPSFTTEQITSIFAQGRFYKWDQLGYAAGANLVTANGVNVPSNTAVHICSRTAGSGTLAITNVLFENAPCVGPVNKIEVTEAIQAATSAVMAPLATNVFGAEGSSGSAKAYHSNVGSGDVDNCLKGLENTTRTAALTPYVAGSAAGSDFRWAVGILNANRNNDGLKGHYRFVKVDGVSPSLANTANGKYKYWSELSYITAKPGTALSTTAQALVTAMSTPALIAASGVNVTTLAGFKSGYLATAGNLGTNDVFNAALPVLPFTHADLNNNAGSVNHCRAAAMLKGTALLPGLN